MSVCDQLQDLTQIRRRKKLKIIGEDLEETFIASLTALEDRTKVAILREMFRSAQGHFNRFMSMLDDPLISAGMGDPWNTDLRLRV